MMRKLVLFAFLACFPLAQSTASDFGTKEEALALVEKTETLLKSVGREKTVAEMSADPKRFVDRDLYITITDEKGVRLFHGQNPKLVGKSLWESLDINGKEYGKEMMNVASTVGAGWVDHMFKDPVTQKVLPKTTYVKKIGDAFVTCGVYHR